MKRTNNFNKFNLHTLASIEKYISSYLIEDDLLILYFKDITFDNYYISNVYLKNIKTLELFKCAFSTFKNCIRIDLANLKYICTNYEYTILLTFESANSYNIVYPKFNNIDKEKSIIFPSNINNINWYLRILDNGKFRLSTIYLFSDIGNDFNSVTSLNKA